LKQTHSTLSAASNLASRFFFDFLQAAAAMMPSLPERQLLCWHIHRISLNLVAELDERG
jgi:hypothetical protein